MYVETCGGLQGYRGGCAALTGNWQHEGRPRAPGRALGLGMEYEKAPPNSCFCNTSLTVSAVGGSLRLCPQAGHTRPNLPF